MKIFNSEGEMEVTEEDLVLIQTAANAYCTPAFIDAINEQLNEGDYMELTGNTIKELS
ncbi:hypothetical protein [Bacteroides sp. 51]|uniref:hypothetical protein n=1 Tax=Bacteroides sp. 51 TaxID=2302938 RepID=UPI0019402B55|nr:hypothetical protein [Bacteroides sp. 51]